MVTPAVITSDEVARIKRELFDNVLAAGAEPYISIRRVYDVVQTYCQGSSTALATTSSTVVTAVGPTSITLASATGYAAAQRVVLDVDDARETVTIRALTGAVASVVCTKTHSGMYPVEIESPLTLVRGLLADLENLALRARAAYGVTGLRRVDEIEWSGGRGEQSIGALIQEERARLRAELASACGLAGLYADLCTRAGSPSGVEIY